MAMKRRRHVHMIKLDLAVPWKDFLVLLTNHDLEGEYFGPLKNMLGGKLDYGEPY